MKSMAHPKAKPSTKKRTTTRPSKDLKGDDFRASNAKVRRANMLGRLLMATMEVCGDTNRRSAAVIDGVVRAAGVSRGAFYWHFDSLDEAIEILGRRLAYEISAETFDLFHDAPLPLDPVLAAAIGGQVMLARGAMDRVWSRYLSNVHVLLDDSRFVKAVRRNLGLGREQGNCLLTSGARSNAS